MAGSEECHDWSCRRCFVEPADGGGRARWTGYGLSGRSFGLSQAMRRVLLGADPPVRLTRRAVEALAEERDRLGHVVHPGRSLIVRDDNDDVRWWTWAGYRANATLAATLSEVVDPVHRGNDQQIRLRQDLTPRCGATRYATSCRGCAYPTSTRKRLWA